MIDTGPLLTLVMLTHNRPRFMARAIRHYANMPYLLLVMDSSPESNAEAAAQYANANVSYQHCPEFAYGAIMQKIRKGVDLVQTPYLAFVTDDDFLTHEGLHESAAFLQQNNDYAICHGYCLMYLADGERVHYFLRDRKVMEEHSADLSVSRILSFMDNFIPPFYAVIRTPVALEWYHAIPDDIRWEFNEFGHAFHLLMAGKARLLPLPYVIRELNYPASDHQTDLLTALHDPAFAPEDKAAFFNWLADLYVQLEPDRSHKDALQVVQQAARTLVQCLGTNKSLTVQEIFYSEWPDMRGAPDWSFTPKQYVEMPFYNAQFFRYLGQIDLLLRAMPAGKLQLQELKPKLDEQELEISRASVAELSGDAESARIALEKVITQNPFHIRALCALYTLLVRHGQAERAEPLRQWARRLDPNAPVVRALDQPLLPAAVTEAIENATPVVAAAAVGPREADAALPELPAEELPATPPAVVRHRIAVVCHLYYPDVWPELVTTLKRIKVPFDLIITTTAEQRQDVLDRVDAEYPQARIYLVENRGRDVGPLFKLLDYEPLQDYDLVLKLHTKKSLHQAEGHGDAWRAELYGGLVPADGIGSVLAFFDAHPEVGLVGTTGSMCSAARVAGSRGENLPGTREWAAKLGRDPDDLEYLFVAGNMFWARGLLFAALRELRVTQEDFDDEQGQVDGTLAHIMERVLPLVADLAGLKTAALPLPALPANVHTPVAVTAPYEQWLLQRAFTLNEAHLIDARRNQLPPQPLRLYIVDRIGNMAAVATSLTSLAEQYHKPVQAVIVSPLPNPDPTSQSGIGWLQGSGAYADLLADAQNASAAWVGFIEAGDRLTREGVLLGLVQAAVQPEWQLLYWDDDWLHENGAPDMPRLKPDFSPDLLRAMPYADGVVVARLGALQQALALGPLEAGAEQNDLICRVYEQHGVNAIAHIPELGVHLAQWPWRGLDEPNRAAAFARVIRDHLARIGQAATLEPGLIGGTLNVRYEHPTAPLVSILIPTKDQFSMISRCVTSLIEHNAYPLFEILVIDNNTCEPDAVAFLDGLIALNNPQIRVLRYPQPFNFSAMNNMAAREAKGEYLLLLNNDTAAIQDNWLEELVRIALRPDVGMVGPRLLYPDGRVQHAGVVLGLRGPADHPFIGMNRDERGYMNRLQVTQNYSAVTAACALIRTSLYHAVGGMDETAFKVSYNDVDLCLKVRAAGYLIVFTPHVSVMHEGSVSQRQLDPAAAQAKADRFRGEQDEMLQRWLPQLALDPYYNRNLLLHGNGFELDQRRPVTFRPISWTPPLRIMSHPADVMGCGNYRIMQPWNALEAAGMISGVVSMELLNPLDLRRIDPDVLVFQRQITEEQIGFMGRSAQFQRAYRIYELDDYLPNLPIKSLHRHHMPKDILRSLRRAVQLTDRFVVSTERLAEAYSDLHNNFHVVHNYLPPAWWGNLPPQRSRGARPRVGWAGGISHTGDLELIVDVVREFAGTVDWVFFGMCPDKLRPYIAEYHEGVPIDRYPAKLASLKLDLALAPLEHNVFNECKSNLRLLEYGACGFATICTDIVPYQGDLPVTRVRNRHKDWADAIRMHLADLDATWAAGDALREAVLSRWMLQGENLGKWVKAWSPD